MSEQKRPILSFFDMVIFNPREETERIIRFIQNETERQGYDGGVVGLSGGIDSSVCAALMVRALGTDRVIGISMTERDSRPEDYDDAKLVAEYLNMEFINHPITEHLESLGFYETTKDINFKHLYNVMLRLEEVYVESPIVEYNACLKLRTRAWILAHYAKLNHYFQCQTLNYSELLLGYHDLFGDGIGDIALIQHLYKSEVYALGEYLKIPQRILARPSMCGNYNRDLDVMFSNEEFLRMSLTDADVILCLMDDVSPLGISEIIKIPEEQVQFIVDICRAAKERWAIPAELSRFVGE